MKHFSITKCKLAEDEDPYIRTSLEIESFVVIVVSQREEGSELNVEMQQTQIQPLLLMLHMLILTGLSKDCLMWFLLLLGFFLSFLFPQKNLSFLHGTRSYVIFFCLSEREFLYPGELCGAPR